VDEEETSVPLYETNSHIRDVFLVAHFFQQECANLSLLGSRSCQTMDAMVWKVSNAIEGKTCEQLGVHDLHLR
jgi:hypothetical protein